MKMKNKKYKFQFKNIKQRFKDEINKGLMNIKDFPECENRKQTVLNGNRNK